jgi:hypothetical protein
MEEEMCELRTIEDHVALKCYWKKKMLLSTHPKASKRKGS